MTALSLALAVLGAVGLGVAVRTVRRRSAVRAERAALARRLARAYDPAEVDEPMVPLRSPDGRVAVLADGLVLALGDATAEARVVPWSGVRSITPTRGGTFAVRIARVGAVEISGALGRQLWETFGAHADRAVPPPTERARLDRV